MSLSNEPGNIRALSDVTLYVLQNLAELDATFLNRYGVILTNDMYQPVEPGTPSAGLVGSTVDVIRRDLSNMAIEDTLECICGALSSIGNAIQGISGGCNVGTDQDADSGTEGGSPPPEFGGNAYEEPSPITDRKCLAANYIYGGVLVVITEYDNQNLVNTVGLGVGLMVTIVATVLGALVAGPFGALIGAVVSQTVNMATALLFSAVDLGQMVSVLTDNQDDLVCALYTSTTADDARTEFLGVVSSSLSSAEQSFLSLFLPNSLLNLLFYAWGDSETYIADTTVYHDCSSCVGETWEEVFDFSGSDGGWVTQSSEGRDFGDYDPGSGWQSVWGSVAAAFDERLYLERDTNASPGSVITEVRYTYSVSGSCTNSVRAITVQHNEVDQDVNSDFVCGFGEEWVIGPLSLSGDGVQIDLVVNFGASSDGEVDLLLHSVTIIGTGSNPFS